MHQRAGVLSSVVCIVCIYRGPHTHMHMFSALLLSTITYLTLRSTQGSSELAHGIGFAFYTAGIRRFAAEAGGGDCVAMPPLSGHVFPKPRGPVIPSDRCF